MTFNRNNVIRILLFFLIILFLVLHTLTLVNQGDFYFNNQFAYNFFMCVFVLIWVLVAFELHRSGPITKLWKINVIEKYFLYFLVLYLICWTLFIVQMDVYGVTTKTGSGYILQGHFKTRFITDQEYQLYDLLKERFYFGWLILLYTALYFVLGESKKYRN